MIVCHTKFAAAGLALSLAAGVMLSDSRPADARAANAPAATRPASSTPTSATQVAAPARLAKCPVDMDKKYFGRDSFVPDWRNGDALDAAAAEVFLKDYWHKYRASHDAGNQGGAPEGLTNAQKAAGVVIFPRDCADSTLPSFVPRAEDLKVNKIASFAALGQSEPFCVAVRTLDAAKAVSVEVSDLTGPGTIAKADITNRLMLAWERTITRKDTTTKGWEQVVMLKTPDNKWKFPPNFTLAYWVDVHVPTDAKPGKYAGTVTVRADGKPAGTVALELEVLPFNLKINNYHHGAFGILYQTRAGGFTGYLEAQMEMDSRYGYDVAGALFHRGNEIPYTGKMETLAVDGNSPKFKSFDATMKLLKKYGLDVAFWSWAGTYKAEQFDNALGFAGVHGIKTLEGKQGFGQILRALKAAEKKHGWPELVINPIAEAFMDQDAVREINQAMPYVQALSPESRLYMEEWHAGYTRLYQSEGDTLAGARRPEDRGPEYKALAGRPPVYNFAIICSNTCSDEGRAIQDALGAEYWTYRYGPAVSQAGRFNCGFDTWRLRTEGRIESANYQGNFDGGWGTFHFALPCGDELEKKAGPYKDLKVLCSVRQAVDRVGTDDRKYIETLRYYATVNKSEADLKWLNDKLPGLCRAWVNDAKGAGPATNAQTAPARARGPAQLRADIKNRIMKLVQK